VFELKLINDIYVICLVSLMKYFFNFYCNYFQYGSSSEFDIKIKILIDC